MSYSQMAQQIVEYFKTQPVVKVWIFGSFARGEEFLHLAIQLFLVELRGSVHMSSEKRNVLYAVLAF